uniref:killer cell lectin-like receptor 2 isoform X3 n=1 Tax=Myodes glareolus TaxID=447135 RepID=UPI0020226B96|nr:killer cell lectin-like receptor 2 isoform X3 [Myodes glareolus]
MMRDQQVIYSNSRVYESFSESQSPARQDETQGPRDVGHKVALGILCLLLMTAIAVWLTYIFQNKYEPMKCQNNLDQSTVQNTSFLNKTLTNKSSDSEGCKNQEGLNRCCGKTKAVVDYGKYTGKCAEAHLLCCGMKCYYFIMDNKRWNDCKLTCQDCSLSFLKIDDDDERKFLKYQLTTNTYWIGLFYEISKSKWQWIDNGPSKFLYYPHGLVHLP